MDRRADPPHRVGGETKPFFGIKTFDCLHQAHIGLRDHLGLRQAIPTIPHRNFSRQTQMRCDQLMGGFGILIFRPTLGQHVFLFGLKQGEFANFLQIAVQPLFGGGCWKICIAAHKHRIPDFRFNLHDLIKKP